MSELSSVAIQPERSTLSSDSPQLGRIISITGSQAVALVDVANKGASDLTLNIQVGSLVKIDTPVSMVFGIVSGLTVPRPSRDPVDSEVKIFGLELLGEIRKGRTQEESGRFLRGVSVFPELGAKVCIAGRTELQEVYEPMGIAKLKIGTACQDESVATFVKTDDLLSKHFAVVGTTGSGKSCLVTLILRRLLAQCPNAHVILLDPHNEYGNAFEDNAEVLAQNNLELPYWLLNFEEIVEVLVDSGTDDRNAQVAILSELLPAAKAQFHAEQNPINTSGRTPGNGFSGVTVDTPVPYSISDLARMIDEIMGRLDKPDDFPAYRKLRARLNLLNSDPRFGFMFGRVTGRDNFGAILSSIFRIPVNGRPITIFDLSGVPSEIINVVVSVLSRITMDFAMWARQTVPILLVCEEAHRYAPADTKLGFEPAKRALSRIAKEGRKYGVSLCVVSQRPSELAADLLSQCNTIFALRLSNEKDQQCIRAATPEAGLGMLDFLPSIRSAEAVVVGEGVTVPMRIRFDQMGERDLPRNQSARFSDLWRDDVAEASIIQEVIGLWRRQE